MNILIPDAWLREHLHSPAKPADIAKHLSLSGPSVERILEGEVYDIEVTTNRVDSMSVRGIAREAATILRRAGFTAKLKDLPARPITTHPSVKLPLPEIVYETEAVKRVLGVVIADVSQPASPDYMQERLAQVEINSHDALIDISNYITHELGHPCHLFDYDEIMRRGGKIFIREARQGKTFITLDEVEHQTVGGEIVFEDSSGEIIDLPAVKGTLNSGVTKATKNVLFWIESLDAKKVRQASMAHAIRTQAAMLNEKHVDPHLADEVLAYGVALMQKLCHGKVASKVYDFFPLRRRPNPIKIKLSTIANYLGITVPAAELTAILRDLDCQVQATADSLQVTPPTFRHDLQIPADIVEEIARIYGYHNLPSQLMAGPLPLHSDQTTDYRLEERVKHLLAALGWYEIYSYSLVSEALAVASGQPLSAHLKLANPLKEEQSYLRRSLIPSLLEVKAQNPQASELSLFELAHVYQPQAKDLPKQQLLLTLLSNKDYRQVRSDLQAVLDKLYVGAAGEQLLVQDLATSQLRLAGATQGAQLFVSRGKQRVTLGQLFIVDGLVALEIDWAALLSVSHKHPSYRKLINTTLIKEDLTFTLPATVGVGEFLANLQTAHADIKSVQLTDQYQRNFTFTCYYQAAARNLTSEEATQIRQQLVATATKTYHAQLVGAL